MVASFTNTAKYRLRRRRSTEIARFHTYGTKKKDRILKEYGPTQLGVPEDDNNIDYALPRSAVDQQGVKEAERLYNQVVGRCFLHPING